MCCGCISNIFFLSDDFSSDKGSMVDFFVFGGVFMMMLLVVIVFLSGVMSL